MKKVVFLLGIVALVSSCKKTTACLQTDKSTAQLGEPVMFSNCSEKYEQLDLEPGDDTEKYNEGDFSSDEVMHVYHEVGSFSASLTATSKNGKKTDNASASVTISSPTKAQLQGVWESDKYESVIVSGSYASVNEYDNIDKINFISDSEYISYQGDTIAYTLAANADLDLNQYRDYTIYTLYNDELVLKWEDPSSTNDVTFYYLYYFTKK